MRRFFVAAIVAASAPLHAAALCGVFDDLLPFVPAAGWPNGWQGFVRIDNSLYGRDRTVHFTATDDAGASYRLSVNVDAYETLHFNSEDLEYGNAAKGGLGGTRAAPTGHWRLCVDTFGQDATSYVRTRDGFLTSMTLVLEGHDFACVVHCPEWLVPVFNPGHNVNQVSVLRIINNSDEDKIVAIVGTREDGSSRHPNGDRRRVEGYVASGEVVELTATQLETGVGLPLHLCDSVGNCVASHGYLGDPDGKWSLRIEGFLGTPSDELVVMSLMRSPTGHVTNLSAGGDDTGSIRR